MRGKPVRLGHGYFLGGFVEICAAACPPPRSGDGILKAKSSFPEGVKIDLRSNISPGGQSSLWVQPV
jgi:hypothetical protein